MLSFSDLCSKYLTTKYLDQMQFNQLELAAVLKVGECMAATDGRTEENELKAIAIGIAEFGIDVDQFKR